MVDIFVGLVAFVIVFELLRPGLSVSNGEVFFCEEFDDDVRGNSFGTGSFVADLEEFPRDLTVECLDDVAVGVFPVPLIRCSMKNGFSLWLTLSELPVAEEKGVGLDLFQSEFFSLTFFSFLNFYWTKVTAV